MLSKKSYLTFTGSAALLTAALLLKSSFFSLLTLLLIVYLVLLFIIPHFMILLLLVARSSFDIFSDITASLGQLSLNVPAIIGLFIIIIGALYLINQRAITKVLSDRISKFFIFWLCALLFWVYIAWNNFGFNGGFLAFREWVRFFSLFMIYGLMFCIVDKFNYHKLANFFFLALVVPLSVAYYQLFTGTGLSINNINRIYGTFAHPNPFGSFLVLFITLTLWKIKTSSNKALWVFVLILELTALINVFAMGVMLMFLGATSVVLLLNIKRNQRLFILVLAVVVMFSFIATNSGQQRISEVANGIDIKSSVEGRGIANTIEWRIFRWSLLVQQWKKRPLLGYGLSTAATSILLPHETKNAPHNDTVRFLAETGLLGLLIYFGFLFKIGAVLWRSYCDLKWRDPELAGLASVLLGIFLAWIIASTIGNPITDTAFQYYFWALFGIVMGSCRQLKLQTKHQSS